MSHAIEEIRDRACARTGRFAIQARLGSGGMGEVYLAEDSLLKRPVAMKAIRSEHREDTSYLERLLKEAERASQLNDEHIAAVHDVVEQEGRMFLVMEYVEGETLRARLRKQLTLEEFFSIAEQCLAGLGAAHRRGILHCDLKPENLMITPAGQVKILDFGFARHSASWMNGETRDSISALAIGGTLAYMAPEVLLGGKPDERTDIFSLGIVLYEALTGRYPFCAPGETAVPAARICHDGRRPAACSAYAGFDRVLLRMMESDPARRYQSCAEALADLRAVHAGKQPSLDEIIQSRTTWAPLKVRMLLSVAVMAVSAALVVPGIRPEPQVLVVLPFRPATGAPADQVYAEELVDAITVVLDEIDKPGALAVIAPAEVRMQNVTNAQQARKVLGATRVLEGSLQRFGNVIRVTYSLVDTKSLRQVRGKVITADASDPLAVQTRVIDAVLSSLKIELDKADRQRIASHGTGQPQAYESYLRGRGYLQGYDRLEDLDRAIAAFQSSVTLDPGFAAAFAGLGQAYVYKYDSTHSPESLVAARSACSRAEELNSGIPDGEICLGMLFSRTGEYEQAARHLQRAVQLDDRSEESLRQLAEAYEQLQRLPEAESALKKAIALHPGYWGGHKHLGAFYADQGRYQEAIEQFQQVVKLAPDSYSGYSNLGAVYLRQGDYAAGIAQLEKSVAIHPTAQALSNLGAAYFYQHNYPDSARSYQAAAQMAPGRYEIFGNLAEAYSQIPGREQEGLGNYAEALKLAEQGLKVNPNDGACLMDAALYAAMLGQNAKAEEYRTAGLERSPQVPVARLRSARVLAQFHRDREAMGELKQALRAGLSATEITNDPAWQRFMAYPEFAALLGRAQKQ